VAQVSDSQTPVKPLAAPWHRRLSWQQTFAALKYPNYRLWFFGQMVSLMGTWMQSTAQGFLVFQLTHSPPSHVGFAAGVPRGCSLCTAASSPTGCRAALC
jgi:hypothetical protein